MPLTVNVKSEPPASAEEGLRLVRVGTGLTMENTSPFDVPPPGLGLETVILTGPPDTKLVPFTVSVNADPPTNAEDGSRLLSLGMGLLAVNGWGFDNPPPGAALKTVTLTVPAKATSAAEMEAVNWVVET